MLGKVGTLLKNWVEALWVGLGIEHVQKMLTLFGKSVTLVSSPTFGLLKV